MTIRSSVCEISDIRTNFTSFQELSHFSCGDVLCYLSIPCKAQSAFNNLQVYLMLAVMAYQVARIPKFRQSLPYQCHSPHQLGSTVSGSRQGSFQRGTLASPAVSASAVSHRVRLPTGSACEPPNRPVHWLAAGSFRPPSASVPLEGTQPAARRSARRKK